MIEVTTARLRLRQWQTRDYEPFALLNADPRVMEYFPTVLDRDASDGLADQLTAAIIRQGWGFWAVELKASETFIGLVGLNYPSPNLPIAPNVEIGWRLGFEFWGHGYATEAAHATLKVGFDLLQLDQVIAFTALSNQRSQAVMERLQMQRDRETFIHPAVPRDSPLREHCLYHLARSDWQRPDDYAQIAIAHV